MRAVAFGLDLPYRDDVVDVVRSVIGASAGDEWHWIEWKSGYELTTKASQFLVARTALGMANRDTVEGVAVVNLTTEPSPSPKSCPPTSTPLRNAEPPNGSRTVSADCRAGSGHPPCGVEPRQFSCGVRRATGGSRVPRVGDCLVGLRSGRRAVPISCVGALALGAAINDARTGRIPNRIILLALTAVAASWPLVAVADDRALLPLLGDIVGGLALSGAPAIFVVARGPTSTSYFVLKK